SKDLEGRMEFAATKARSPPSRTPWMAFAGSPRHGSAFELGKLARSSSRRTRQRPRAEIDTGVREGGLSAVVAAVYNRLSPLPRPHDSPRRRRAERLHSRYAGMPASMIASPMALFAG